MKKANSITRNALALFFLSLYLTTVFSAIIPYIEYALNYDYISEILCINKDVPESHCKGKCHLNKQIEKVVKSQIPVSGNERTPVVVTAKDFYPAIIQEINIDLEAPILDLRKLHSKNILYSKEIYKSIFHPPPVS